MKRPWIRRLCVLSLFMILWLLFLAGDSQRESISTDAVPGGVEGWIVFDSNRHGQFDIFKMRPDGRSVVRLTSDPRWDIYPDWSRDGQKIVFARHRPGETRGQGRILIIGADGGEETLVSKEGTFPQFYGDDRFVIFERDRRQVVIHDLKSGEERVLAPPPGVPFGYQIVKPRLSPGEGRVLFTSDRGGQWKLWSMDMKGRAWKITAGCEGFWHPDGKSLFFILGSRWTGTAVGHAAYPDGPVEEYLALPGNYSHVYFPSVSNDGKYLLFSACPADEHDHFSANYQIFIRPMAGKESYRLSRNSFTERWPRLWVDLGRQLVDSP